jgi:hypothetical protein
VLERLNAGKTVRSFLIATVELLTEAVNILVPYLTGVVMGATSVAPGCASFYRVVVVNGLRDDIASSI